MLIGLCGPAGAGKTTLAGALMLEYGAKLVKFAGPLKDALRAMGLNDRMIEGDLKEQPLDMLCGRTPRFLMQTLGTEWGRQIIGEELWVRLWQFKVQAMLDRGEHVVVDDVRFDNEAQAIKDFGGMIVRVTRRDSALLASESARHASEHGLEAHWWDRVIQNSGDAAALCSFGVAEFRHAFATKGAA